MAETSLSARVLTGSLWSIATEALAGSGKALSYLIYARLLSPGDFGIFALCLLIINFFPLVIDNTLSLALIKQDQRDEQRVFSVIFYLNVALAFVAVLLIVPLSGLLAHLFHDHRVVSLLPILSLQLIFNSLCAPSIAIARRSFEYKRLVPIRLLSTVASLALGIPLALYGHTYWALVGSSLVGAFVQMLASWILLSWRPSLVFDWAIAKSLSGFSFWVATDMAVTWLVMSGGGFFLAFYLGAHDLGIYRFSDQVNTYVFGAVLTPLIPVLYSAYCEAGRTQSGWRDVFVHSLRTVAMIAMIEAGAVIVLAHPIETVIGPRWHGISRIIFFNAIADCISYAILPIPSLLRSRAQAKSVAGMRLVLVAGQCVVYSFVAPLGLRDFVVGKIGLEMLMFVISYVLVYRLCAMPVAAVLRRQFVQLLVVLCSSMIGLSVVAADTSRGPLLSAAGGLVSFAAPLALFVYLTERQSITWLLNFRRPKTSD